MSSAPSPCVTKTGSPPTAPNARTGEFTPPGMRACARSNSEPVTRDSRRPRSREQALGEVPREVGEHEVGARPLDREQMLERDRVAVEPAELSRRLHHRV